MKSKTYKNIFLVTTQNGREEIVYDFMQSKAMQQAIKQEDLILLCFADAEKTKTKRTDYGHNVRELFLDCPEKYAQLSLKTLKSIQYCCKNFKFERLHKCDDNKMINEEVYDINYNKYDFQGCCKHQIPRQHDRYINKNKHKCIKLPTHFLKLGLDQCEKRTFDRWSKKRGIWVDLWHYDNEVWYSNWKPYSISYNFAQILSKADKYEFLYRKYLAGCEDHMIGKVYKDLQLYFNLTAE